MLASSFSKTGKLAVSCGLIWLAAALSGCDKANSVSNATTATRAQSDSAQSLEQRKYNLYVKGFNRLLDNTFGLVGTTRLYAEMKLDRAKPTDSIHAPSSSRYYTEAIDALTEARGLSVPGAQAADAAADSLLKTLPVVISRIDEISPYFKTGAYREDKLARGKAQDAETQAALKAAMASLDQMSQALSVHQRQSQTAQAEAFRKEGNLPAYYTLNSLTLANQMVDAMTDKDVAGADKIVPDLEASLEGLRKSLADVKDPMTKSSMGMVHSALAHSVGFMRQYKSQKSDSSINAMLSSYNSAVDASNNLR